MHNWEISFGQRNNQFELDKEEVSGKVEQGVKAGGEKWGLFGRGEDENSEGGWGGE